MAPLLAYPMPFAIAIVFALADIACKGVSAMHKLDCWATGFRNRRTGLKASTLKNRVPQPHMQGSARRWDLNDFRSMIGLRRQKPTGGPFHHKPDPPVLKVWARNVHPVRFKSMGKAFAKAGMALTENRSEAHVHISLSTACDEVTVPTIYGGAMSNGVPFRKAKKAGAKFDPTKSSNCKYWVAKKESEVEMLSAYTEKFGLKAGFIPQFHDEMQVVGEVWHPQNESEINSYINKYAQRFPTEFAKAFKVKRALQKGGITVHLHGANAADVDGPVAMFGQEKFAHFARSKFTLHIKVHGGTYYCQAVSESIAAGVPVVVDRQTNEIGMFDGLIEHNVSGVVLDNVDDIVRYIETVPDAEYRRLRASTRRFGSRFRALPSDEQAAKMKQFFWTVYRDSVFTM